MDLSTFLAVLASFHFTCADPQVSVQTQDPHAPKGLYAHTNDGKNVILIREDAWNSGQRDMVVMHELLHCALYEERERNGWAHPPSFDPREEQSVLKLTELAMERLR